ncbi:hypothetical protein M8332_07125 (plasmid) [Fructilactobacillus ixorae]|uniref:Uncharacterized protein n=1 Tax=Fructilactobacillus ixorae TaxID=1750535 RepID=A0ABY5C843_9LACO|nr:hypothetical protein [Fructilactobacillus ixorae]USS93988.1 hypothetical protein M8332_07125 [Fructilactobacillus ixorae]
MASNVIEKDLFLEFLDQAKYRKWLDRFEKQVNSTKDDTVTFVHKGTVVIYNKQTSPNVVSSGIVKQLIKILKNPSNLISMEMCVNKFPNDADVKLRDKNGELFVEASNLSADQIKRLEKMDE